MFRQKNYSEDIFFFFIILLFFLRKFGISQLESETSLEKEIAIKISKCLIFSVDKKILFEKAKENILLIQSKKTEMQDELGPTSPLDLVSSLCLKPS